MSDVDNSDAVVDQIAQRLMPALLTAAEERGYDRAVANLRSLAENTTGSFRQPYRNAADWLEEHATRETTL